LPLERLKQDTGGMITLTHSQFAEVARKRPTGWRDVAAKAAVADNPWTFTEDAWRTLQEQFVAYVQLDPEDVQELNHKAAIGGQGDVGDLSKYFDRVVVINMKRRPDRLADFESNLRKWGWPFAWPTWVEGVDGASNKLPTPYGHRDGGGAWGCMLSHRRVLESAILDGVDKLLVLEDDARIGKDFTQKVKEFLENVPDDWDQLMLGGQHIGRSLPVTVNATVVRCKNTQRTHAYALRGDYLKALYQYWVSTVGHCDHRMGEVQIRYKVYAPKRFLVSQAHGKSDISGGMNAAKRWSAPVEGQPVVLLRAPGAVVRKLRAWGFHTGYSRDVATGYDLGLLDVLGLPEGDRRNRMVRWLYTLQWECAAEEGLVCTVWHPEIEEAFLRQVSSEDVHVIRADTEIEAVQQASALGLPLREAPLYVSDTLVLLKAPRTVVVELRKHGFHTGYWRDETSSIDMGLLDIFDAEHDEDTRRKKMSEWIACVSQEAEALREGVAAVWHPKATVEFLQSATDMKVVELEASTEAEALDKWKGSR